MVKRILMFVFTVIVVSIIGGLAFLYFRKPALAPVSAARVRVTPERIARGKYLLSMWPIAVAVIPGATSDV